MRKADKVDLSVAVLSCSNRIGRNDVSLDAMYDTYDDLVLRVDRYIAEDRKSIIIEYPAGWWQALKKDYLKCLIRFLPIKKKSVEVTAKMYYPYIAIPDEQVYIHLERTEGVS